MKKKIRWGHESNREANVRIGRIYIHCPIRLSSFVVGEEGVGAGRDEGRRKNGDSPNMGERRHQRHSGNARLRGVATRGLLFSWATSFSPAIPFRSIRSSFRSSRAKWLPPPSVVRSLGTLTLPLPDSKKMNKLAVGERGETASTK